MKGVVSKDISLELKGLGFNVRCTHYYEGEKLKTNNNVFGWDFNNSFLTCCSAPFYQQVFDWFRDKHDLWIEISKPHSWLLTILDKEQNKRMCLEDYDDYTEPTSYKEAQDVCIKRLIQIVKNG